MLECCTLGTGGALPLPTRALASLYVRVNGRGLLIDCGEGTQTGVRRLGWGFINTTRTADPLSRGSLRRARGWLLPSRRRSAPRRFTSMARRACGACSRA